MGRPVGNPARMPRPRYVPPMIVVRTRYGTRGLLPPTIPPVSNQDWQEFLDAHVPQVTPTGQPLTGRASTLADRKRHGAGAAVE